MELTVEVNMGNQQSEGVGDVGSVQRAGAAGKQQAQSSPHGKQPAAVRTNGSAAPHTRTAYITSISEHKTVSSRVKAQAGDDK